MIIKKITLICSLLIAMLSYARADGINTNWIKSGSGGLMSLSLNEPIREFPFICDTTTTPYYFYIIYADDSPPAPRYYLKKLDPGGRPAYYDGQGGGCASILRKYIPGTLTVTVPIAPVDNVSFIGIAPSTIHYNEGYRSSIPWANGWLKGNSGTGMRLPKLEAPKPSCSADQVSINYGPLAPDVVHGARMTKFLVIKCIGGDTSVWVYTMTNTLSLRSSDPSLTAKLLINGQTATTGILATVLKGRETRVPITSVLNYSGSGNPASGKFSGTTVINIEVL